MSKWDEAHTEPLHDHPAEKDQLVAAMEAAGYVLDTLESTEDNLRFYGAYGNLLTMGGWHECEEWLNGVVFDDPQVSDRVEFILHPERFPERDPQRAALRAVEDSVEQNDNHFDGVINNQPQPDPAEILRQNARESEASEERRSVLEALKERQAQAFTRRGGTGESMKIRNQEIHVLWTKEEWERLHEKMQEAGVKNRSAYIRKMSLDGYIVKLDTSDINQMIALLRNATNNLNQVAKKANSTGSIYGADIADMQAKQDEIWETAKEILARLATIQ